jgi:hypothetical protein
MNTRTFGRRNALPRPRDENRDVAEALARAEPAIADQVPHQIASPAAPSIDEELRAWKEERRRQNPFRIPWRQLSLVASLSFFIGSFALPASVNAAADCVLYPLAAMSFWVWWSGRRRKTNPDMAP